MTTTSNDPAAPVDLVRDSARATLALRRAVRAALIMHKRDGEAVAVWEDGHVRWIAAEDIIIPDLDDD